MPTMDLVALTSAWTPSQVDMSTGWSDLVRFEMATLRCMVEIYTQEPSNLTPADAQAAKMVVDLKKHMSIRMQSMLRSSPLAKTAGDKLTAQVILNVVLHRIFFTSYLQVAG